MNKTELIATVAEKAVSAVFEGITESLKAGDKVALVGFGTFDVKDREERLAKNPRTGEPVVVPATRVPLFKAGKGLKDAVAD